MKIQVSNLRRWEWRGERALGTGARPALLRDRAPFPRAFTLIELLTVIAIIGLLAALIAPVIKNFSKPHTQLAATRQMLDDCARARQLAISRRSTVYVVFIPTNFWGQPPNTLNSAAWSSLPLPLQTSTTITQMYGAQWNGYYIESLRNVGDQPGRGIPQDLMPVRTLPQGSFIAPFKFTTYTYPSISAPYPTNRTDLPIYRFEVTNNIPFPTADVLTNSIYVNTFNASGGFSLPYIAFNYLGQLTPGDGSLLPYDENIPIEYGTIAEPMSPTSKAPTRGFPTITEMAPGNSTNISFNIIHIDHLTGRARLERQEVQ